MSDYSRKSILLVEDEAIIALHEKLILTEQGFVVHTAVNGEAAVSWVAEDHPVDLVLMDIDLGAGIDGTEAASRILSIRSLPIVFLTSHAEEAMVRRVKNITKYGYVLKNAGEFVLLEAIRTAFELFDAHQRLEVSERRYRTMIETAPMPFHSLDSEARVIDANSSWLSALGYEREEIIGRWMGELVHPEERDRFGAGFERFKVKGSLSGCEYRLRHRDGRWLEARVSGNAIHDEAGRFSHTVCVITLSDREEAQRQPAGGAGHYLEEELYELVRKDPAVFDFLQAGSLDGIWYWDLEDPEHEWMSPRFWEILGYDPADMRHTPEEWQGIINNDDLETAMENLKRHLEDPSYPYDQIVRYTHREGGSVWVRCRGIAIRDTDGTPLRMLGAHNDLTPYMRALETKELLMQEFNHRVKNNLSMIDALIQLKQRDLTGSVDLSDLRHQIDTIRMVHESLQDAESLSEVEIAPYLERLLSGVFSSAPVSVRHSVTGGKLLVSTRKAAPLGLIINELASNAQKHGFNGEEVHAFSVDISEDRSKDEVKVAIANSGRPFPEDVDLEHSSSLGLRLVSALTSQLDGEISLRKAPTPQFLIRFPGGGNR